MIAHHGQAVQLGAIGAETATDPDVAGFSLDAVIAEQYQVGDMTSLLEDWGYGTGDPTVTPWPGWACRRPSVGVPIQAMASRSASPVPYPQSSSNEVM